MRSVGEAHDRARHAEASVLGRHLRALPWAPWVQLGTVTAPAPPRGRWFVDYNYWWQAHLLDALIDAQVRDPDPDRMRTVRRVSRGLWLRNHARVVNDYFDDMAWLALALGRGRQELGLERPGWERRLGCELRNRWHDDAGRGGIPWRRGDVFRNVPANGAAALVYARTGHPDLAQETIEWLYAFLHDPATGLFFDGRRPDGIDRRLFTYNQGLVAATLTALPDQQANRVRLHALVEAMEGRCTAEGVLNGCGGGDGGLFAAITGRFLADVALTWPGSADEDHHTRARARHMVLTSAEAAWQHRAVRGDDVWFGPDWRVDAVIPEGTSPLVRTPGGSSTPAERDLSVQLGGWMILEQAARLERHQQAGEGAVA